MEHVSLRPTSCASLGFRPQTETTCSVSNSMFRDGSTVYAKGQRTLVSTKKLKLRVVRDGNVLFDDTFLATRAQLRSPSITGDHFGRGGDGRKIYGAELASVVPAKATCFAVIRDAAEKVVAAAAAHFPE